MKLTRNALGNLVSRYAAVLKKRGLCNAFGSFAVAGVLVLGGVGMALADSGIEYCSSTSGAPNTVSWEVFRGQTAVHFAGIYNEHNLAAGGDVELTEGKDGASFYGGFSFSGDAKGNAVTMTGGQAGSVFGGYSERGAAEENTVIISGGTVTWDVYGGYSGSLSTGDPYVPPPKQHAINNTVILSNALVGGSVLGGKIISSRDQGDEVTGNRLTVTGISSVGAVGNFQYLNFEIPENFNKASDALLTADYVTYGRLGSPLSEVESVNILCEGKVDDVFTLIKTDIKVFGGLKVGGKIITNRTAGTIREETLDYSYTYSLYFNDLYMTELYAKIIEVRPNGNDFWTELGNELGSMFDEVFASGEVKPSFANDYSKPSGVRFLSRAINEKYGNSSEEAAKAVRGASQLAVIASVPQMTMQANLAGVNAMWQRTSITQPVGPLQSVAIDADDKASGLNSGDGTGMSAGNGYDKSGFAMWIMPLWQSNNGFGLKSGDYKMDTHASIGGIAIGADYTIDQAIRLGLTFNMGGGYAEGSGDFAETTNNMNFWGVGAYAGWAQNNFGLQADINFTSTFNNVKQEMHPSLAMRDNEAEITATALSAGLRAEYKFSTDALNITPHAGVRYIYLTTYGHDVENGGETLLEANASRQNIWTFPIGVQFDKSFALENDWYVKPSLDLNVTPAAGDIDVKRDIRFTGVTASASPETQTMDWITYGGQAGLEFGNENVKLGLNYNVQLGAHTTNHGVSGSFRYEF